MRETEAPDQTRILCVSTESPLATTPRNLVLIELHLQPAPRRESDLT